MKKKKMLMFCMAVVMTFSLAACSGDKDRSPKDTNKEQPKEESSGKKEPEKEESADIEVTLPSYFFDEEGMADINEQAKADGVKDVTVNSDGSVTYRMNKAAHEKLLLTMKEGINEAAADILADKENYPSYTDITFNDEVTEFRIMVDPASYGGMESFGALALYELGSLYQGMNLVPEDQINTAVYFVNKDTQEIIEGGDSRSMAEEYQGE